MEGTNSPNKIMNFDEFLASQKGDHVQSMDQFSQEETPMGGPESTEPVGTEVQAPDQTDLTMVDEPEAETEPVETGTEPESPESPEVQQA